MSRTVNGGRRIVRAGGRASFAGRDAGSLCPRMDVGNSRADFCMAVRPMARIVPHFVADSEDSTSEAMPMKPIRYDAAIGRGGVVVLLVGGKRAGRV